MSLNLPSVSESRHLEAPNWVWQLLHSQQLQHVCEDCQVGANGNSEIFGDYVEWEYCTGVWNWDIWSQKKHLNHHTTKDILLLCSVSAKSGFKLAGFIKDKVSDQILALALTVEKKLSQGTAKETEELQHCFVGAVCKWTNWEYQDVELGIKHPGGTVFALSCKSLPETAHTILHVRLA